MRPWKRIARTAQRHRAPASSGGAPASMSASALDSASTALPDARRADAMPASACTRRQSPGSRPASCSS
jgi:hypothetical protein